jgi:Outer membrane protein beta-barrel domain
MKKGRFLALAVFILSVSQTKAQGLHIGIKAGTNGSQITGRSFTSGFQWGFNVGAFAELNITSKWGLQPELDYNQVNSQTSNDFNTIVNESSGNVGLVNRSFTLNYLNIPVLLNYRFLPILSFQLGPQFGVLMSTSQNITSNGKSPFKTSDFGVAAGAQLNLIKFKIGLRYVYGLTNINNVTSNDSWNNQNIQAYIGLRIF